MIEGPGLENNAYSILALHDDGTLTVTVQTVASGTKVIPGIFGAIVRTTARKTLPNGSQRDFDNWSNEVGFAIAPTILSVTGGAVKKNALPAENSFVTFSSIATLAVV